MKNSSHYWSNKRRCQAKRLQCFLFLCCWHLCKNVTLGIFHNPHTALANLILEIVCMFLWLNAGSLGLLQLPGRFISGFLRPFSMRSTDFLQAAAARQSRFSIFPSFFLRSWNMLCTVVCSAHAPQSKATTFARVPLSPTRFLSLLMGVILLFMIWLAMSACRWRTLNLWHRSTSSFSVSMVKRGLRTTAVSFLRFRTWPTLSVTLSSFGWDIDKSSGSPCQNCNL